MSNSFNNALARKTNLSSGSLIALGAFFICLGLVSAFDMVGTTLASIVILGVILIFGGVAQILFSLSSNTTNKVLSILMGLLYIIAGGAMIDEPASGSTFFTAFLSGGLIFAGIMRAIWASTHRSFGNWLPVLLSGIFALLIGILLFATLPWSGLWLIGSFIAFELIFAGVSFLMLGISLRR
ncbi:HdeD family acid-resistance protein [Swingsia samuiensis]|uniref:HdeD family acid-resistance protein n=1 Tax=Swingsia samuiensis TaxID=1293412 RepID=A0A4Y6UJ03_9PROT|nr:DUF308 domain-containing protein [Swingsia samuiensis]QDH16800.1 HdeD family acid-resistance protein [Swingsia samuiensis]